MRTKLTLHPGQRGTRKLVTKYGDQLVCVRYRYDEAQKKRYKTVELIEEAVDWEPNGKSGETRPVAIRIEWSEEEMREKVKAAGGRWDQERKVWWMTYGQVQLLGWVERIVRSAEETD